MVRFAVLRQCLKQNESTFRRNMAKHKAPFRGVTQDQPSSLFSILFSTTTLTVFAIQIFRAKNISESIDKTIFALSVLIGGYLFLKSFGKKIIGTQPLVVSVLAFLVAGIGIFGIEKHPTIVKKQ